MVVSTPSVSAARIGPMVPRTAKIGGALAAAGSLQFVVSMIVVQLYYPGYSVSQNAISDLGSSMSPLAWLFNGSIRVLGILGVTAAILIFSAFRSRWSTWAGIGALVIASSSAFAVGTFPESSPELGGHIHSIVSAITFVFSGIALLLLALAMVRDTRWQGYRLYTAISGVVTLVATGLYVAAIYPVLGPGGMERLVVAPILLWSIVVGVHLLRLGTYVPARADESSPSGSAT